MTMQNEPQLPKDVESRFRDEIGVQDNDKNMNHPYFCCGGDFCGGHSEDMTSIKSFLATELERQRQEYIEAVEKLKYGQNVIINAVSRSEKAELAEPLLSHNKTLDDVLAILKKARE